ncbi:histidine phosphatase family protein [Falsiroseomonas sp. E2-1-a20]|uniref:histidine phosphatase family protein n=1 Tax=Falsiroseomonas sp. E2-1-a20 TaxID=3239300 RepID=UPI003F332FBE
MILRRILFAILLLGLAGPSQAEPAWDALREGGIVLFRHALAPGGGDPPGMRLGDCATQRNLSAEGRAQAVRIGQAFRERGIAVGAVLASGWCRARETADLAFPGHARREPVFDSFFADRAAGPAQTEAARRMLLGWSGPGALVVSTHQVNITALTGALSASGVGIFPASGEGIVLARRDGALAVVGRIRP